MNFQKEREQLKEAFYTMKANASDNVSLEQINEDYERYFKTAISAIGVVENIKNPSSLNVHGKILFSSDSL